MLLSGNLVCSRFPATKGINTNSYERHSYQLVILVLQLFSFTNTLMLTKVMGMALATQCIMNAYVWQRKQSSCLTTHRRRNFNYQIMAIRWNSSIIKGEWVGGYFEYKQPLLFKLFSIMKSNIITSFHH